MKVLLLKYLLIFLGIGILGTFIQQSVVDALGLDLFFPAWKNYAFHFATSAVLSTGVFVIRKYAFQSTGFAFVGGGLLKMALSIVFLSPLIFSDQTGYIPDVAAFFIAYFIFLTAEVLFAARLLSED